MQEFEINPEKLKAYKEKDLDYKDQARDILCRYLGYEPPLNISILSELNLRHCLRMFDYGKASKESLDEVIAIQIQFINRLMLERIPAYNC